MNSKRKRTKVLHVLGALNYGGVETWLTSLLRYTDSNSLSMDFFVHTTQQSALDGRITELGGRVYRGVPPRMLLVYLYRLYRHLRHESYDVVHSHVHHFSGIVLLIARVAGVSIRIAHSHNDTKEQQSSSSRLKQLYYKMMRYLLTRHATNWLAASADAGAALYSDRISYTVLHCGIDLHPYLSGHSVAQTRAPKSGTLTVVHVGRFVEQKNHTLLIDIFRELVDIAPHTRLLLIGDGPERPNVEAKVNELGLMQQVSFLGIRDDVAAILMNAADVFILPSRYEGLGLVLIEAQAAGVPIVYSDRVPTEAAVVPELCFRVPLDDSLAAWAGAVLEATKVPDDIRRASYEVVRMSEFNAANSALRLSHVYTYNASASKY